MPAVANILKTEALVLRVVPFSETSHVVTWLTPEYGRVSTAIKGACRPRSPFLGQYDLYYTCELLFYERENSGLHAARECTPLNLRPQLRDDWKSACSASYLCDLAARVIVLPEHTRDLYHLIQLALDTLCLQGTRPAFLFWVELRLASQLGLAPQLTKCAACGDALPPTPDRPLFSSPHGGILCPACSREHHHSSLTITPDVIAMLQRWQQESSPRTVLKTRCSLNQLLAFRQLLGMFLQYHLDVPLHSRRLALDALMPGQRNGGMPW